jgi:hypothetical protein
MKKLILYTLALAVSQKAMAVDLMNPGQYTTPSSIFIQAEKVLTSDNDDLAKVAYSDGLKALRGEIKHPSVLTGAKTLLANTYSVRIGVGKPNDVLLTLCYTLTNSPLIDSASDEERQFRQELYSTCSPLFEQVLNKPAIDKASIQFDLSEDILAFDPSTNMLIVGDEPTSTISSLTIKPVYPDAPDKVVFTASKIGESEWLQVQNLFDSKVAEVRFNFSTSESHVEVYSSNGTKAMKSVWSLEHFISIKPEVMYELAEH